MKASQTSAGQVVQQNVIDEFNEMSQTLQEKAVKSDTRINETLELVESQGKVMVALREATQEINKGALATEQHLQKVELKVKSCVEEVSKLEQVAKLADVRKLEKAVSERASASDVKDMQAKVTSLATDMVEQVKELGRQQTKLGSSVTGLMGQVSGVGELATVAEDLSLTSS